MQRSARSLVGCTFCSSSSMRFWSCLISSTVLVSSARKFSAGICTPTMAPISSTPKSLVRLVLIAFAQFLPDLDAPLNPYHRRRLHAIQFGRLRLAAAGGPIGQRVSDDVAPIPIHCEVEPLPNPMAGHVSEEPLRLAGIRQRRPAVTQPGVQR